MDATDSFDALVQALVNSPGVTPLDRSAGSRFGSSALKVDGAIFAMLTRSALVVKLPQDRVAACVADGTGTTFDAGKGTPMKEWLTVAGDDLDVWLELSREALEFVGRRSKHRREPNA